MLNNTNKLRILRGAVICIAFLAASFTFVSAQDDEEITPRIRVMAFYKWYLHWTNEKHDLTKNKSSMENYFSAQFNGRIYSTEGQSAGRSLFVDGQQWSNAWAKNVNVGEAAITGNKAALKLVLGAPSDALAKTLQISLVKVGPDWKIDSISSIENDRVTAPTKTAAAAPANNAPVGAPERDSSGKLIIPIVRRDLTLADLAGEWGDSDRIATHYVYRSDGSHAGTDSASFKSKWTIRANGSYTLDFFEIRNRKTFNDLDTGTISINGRLLTQSPKEYGVMRVVVIGWLELPDMTLMTVSTIYSASSAIPESVLTTNDPREYATVWVRKK